MVLAILLGVLAGLVGFVPLVIGLKLTKRTTHGGTAASMIVLMLGLVVSFALLFAFAALFFGYDHDRGIAFLLAEVLALSAAAIGFALWQMLRR
ncbi:MULTISPECIES: hypothetical protein [unclassified Adlercreutzia]|uniref:hypothetical protein n=1 Tax=unclassified Adlercreutzia TaxID=2636013 RepID=UPI0013EAA399|nr:MULTISPECIES: hypothetical protein [unclassified Adlercreutzia]